MNIDELTLGQIKEIRCLLGANNNDAVVSNNNSLNNDIIGRKCIIRTYSAGVWFGTVLEKTKNECVIGDARRMYKWVTTDKGITLSEVSLTGVTNESKIQAPVSKVWLQQIELIPCTDIAIKSLESKANYVYS